MQREANQGEALAQPEQIVRQFAQQYFVARDLSQVLRLLSDDICWFNATPDGVCNGKAAFEKTARQYLATPAVVGLVWQPFHIRMFGANCTEVRGEAVMEQLPSSERLLSCRMHMSALLCLGEDGWRICTLHMTALHGAGIPEMAALQRNLEEKNERLERKRKELLSFYNTVISGIAKIAEDEDDTFLYGSKRYYRMLGFEPPQDEQLLTEEYFCLTKKDRKGFAEVLRATEGTQPFSYKGRVRKKDGSWLGVRIDGCRSEEHVGERPVLYCLFTDIQEQWEQEQNMRKQQYFISLLLSNKAAGTMIAYQDDRHSFAYVGDGLYHFLGYSKKEFRTMFHGALDLIWEQTQRETLHRSIEEQVALGNFYEVDYQTQRRDGSVIWVTERGHGSVDEDGQSVLIGVVFDISARKRTQEELLLESKRDALTGILNRRAAEAEIDLWLQKAEKSSALLLLDVDNFKQVNDSCGHLEGDRVLTDISRILTKIFRHNDIIARLGGDEFIVFVKDVNTLETVCKKAQDVCEQVSQSMAASVSIGVSMTREHGDSSFRELYHDADEALYRAKCGGRNTYRFQM